MARRLWFVVHSWVGLKLSVLTSVVFVTGTLATVAHDIDWLLNPDLRVGVESKPIAWAEIASAAQAAHPSWHIFLISAPYEPWFAAEVQGYTSAGERRRIYVNPYTAQVTGEGGWVNVHRVLRQTHRHLMLPVKFGVPIVSIAAFVLILSIATGVIVYRQWWRGFLRWPRTASRRQFWGDMHRLLGVWSLGFGVVIGATGLWYAAEITGLDARPPLLPRAQAAPDGDYQTTTLSELLNTTREAFSGLDIQHIRLPLKRGEPLIVEGYAQTILVRPQANRVALDPFTGEVLSIQYGEDLSVHQRVSEMADPLHFGTFGGFASRLLYFVFGTVLSTLSLSGVYLYGMRAVKGIDHSKSAAVTTALSSYARES
ncbi:MAG: PepSY-associated TM helix domain-containing protein [Rhodospirillaceae bacterium]